MTMTSIFRCLTMAITFLGGLKDNQSVLRTLVTIGTLVHDMDDKGRQKAEQLVTNINLPINFFIQRLHRLL